MVASKIKPCSIDTMQSENDKVFYHPVPIGIAADPKLCANAKLIAGYIHGFEIRGMECRASNEFIGMQFGISGKTVANLLKFLRKRGYIYPYDGSAKNRKLSIFSTKTSDEPSRSRECNLPDSGNIHSRSREHTIRVLNEITRREVLDEYNIPQIGNSTDGLGNKSLFSGEDTISPDGQLETYGDLSPEVSAVVREIHNKIPSMEKLTSTDLRFIEEAATRNNSGCMAEDVLGYTGNHGIHGLMEEMRRMWA